MLNSPFFVSAFGFDLSPRHYWFRREVVGTIRVLPSPEALLSHPPVGAFCLFSRQVASHIGRCLLRGDKSRTASKLRAGLGIGF